MPEPSTTTATRVDEEVIKAVAAEAVFATPGVTRIELTMRKAVDEIVHRAQAVAGLVQRGGGASGVVVVAHDDGSLDVSVEIGVALPHQALDTAHRARGAIREALTRLDCTPGRVSVSVLSLERSAVDAREPGPTALISAR